MSKLPAAPAADEIPAYFTLGKTSAEINVDSAEENRNAVISLAKQAKRLIYIYTQDFDAPLYDNDEFHDSLFAMARENTSASIKIISHDSQIAVQNSHCIIRLAQNLTSFISVRTPPAEHRNFNSAFLVADNQGFLYRLNADNYSAAINFMSPARARKLSEFFIDVWEQSEPDAYVRHLKI